MLPKEIKFVSVFFVSVCSSLRVCSNNWYQSLEAMSEDKLPKKETPPAVAVVGRSLIRGVPIQYPMLTETNYGLWAVKMKIIL